MIIINHFYELIICANFSGISVYLFQDRICFICSFLGKIVPLNTKMSIFHCHFDFVFLKNRK